MFMRLFLSSLLITFFISVPAIALVDKNSTYRQSQQVQAQPQTATDWLRRGTELARTSPGAEEAMAAFREAIRLQPDLEDAYLRLASALRVVGKPNEQIAVLFSAREFLPASVELMKALRAALLAEKNYDDLVKITPEYLVLHPEDASARNDFGWALMNLKRYNEAAIELEQAVAIDGKLGIALHNLAATYANLGRTEEAVKTYERILAVDPNYIKRDSVWWYRISDLLKLGRIDDALTAVGVELAQNPESGLAYAVRGHIRFVQQQYDNAIIDFKKAEELGCPYNIRYEAYMDFGYAYLRTGQYLEASVELVKAADLKPDSFTAQSALAYAYSKASLCEKAMDPFQKAIRINPEDPAIYNNLSFCFVKLGQLDYAEKGLRYAIQMDPKNVGPRLNLSRVLMQQKRTDAAESELRTAVRMNIADCMTYVMLGDIMMLRKNMTESVAFYRQALRLRPEDPMIMNNLGYALVELNEHLDEALELLQNAVKRSPHDAAIRDSLGWAYFKLDRLTEANREIIEAVRMDPKSAAGFEHLGDINQKLGKTVDARTCWQKALTLAAGNDEMKTRLQAKLDSK